MNGRTTPHLRYPLIAMVWLTAGAVHGQSTIYSETTDAAASYDALTPATPYSTRGLTDVTLNIGRQGTSGRYHYSPVLPFQLPDLGGVSDPFLSASFTFDFNSVQNITGINVDLYGLPSRATSDVLPGATLTTDLGDFYMAGISDLPEDDVTPGVTKIQDNILTLDSTTGLISTDAAGSAALLSYLNGQYAGGAGAGQYVFLRLNLDGTPVSGTGRYNITTANGADGAADLTLWPQITYTAVPEPSSLALLLCAGLFAGPLMARRRS